MLKKDIIVEIQEELYKLNDIKKNDYTKNKIQLVLDSFFSIIQKNVSEGKSIKLVGFGTFEPKIKPSREAVNPRSGERVVVEKHSVPVFRAGKDFLNQTKETFKIIEQNKTKMEE